MQRPILASIVNVTAETIDVCGRTLTPGQPAFVLKNRAFHSHEDLFGKFAELLTNGSIVCFDFFSTPLNFADTMADVQLTAIDVKNTGTFSIDNNWYQLQASFIKAAILFQLKMFDWTKSTVTRRASLAKAKDMLFFVDIGEFGVACDICDELAAVASADEFLSPTRIMTYKMYINSMTE